jgi:hypothetical protein
MLFHCVDRIYKVLRNEHIMKYNQSTNLMLMSGINLKMEVPLKVKEHLGDLQPLQIFINLLFTIKDH